MMDSVLPPAHSGVRTRRQGHVGGNPRGGRVPRSEKGVKRQRSCPTAVRMFHLCSDDVATRSGMCAAVLGVHSAIAAEETSPAPGPSQPTSANTAVKPAPVAVVQVWADTTVLEVVQQLVPTLRRLLDERGSEEDEQHQAKAGTSMDEEEPTKYNLEFLVGGVSAEGQASLRSMGAITLRQVLAGQRWLYPMRRPRDTTAIDWCACWMDLGYQIGDPIFFTCSRQ